MTILSQRDPRWASIKLGTSSTDTIGKFGCLITCFAMYVGKTPDEVNTILKNNGGFQSEDLFIWSKCTLLGLTQTYLSPRFSSSAVTTQTLNKLKELLDQHYPLVCEIDFNPSSTEEEMHYLLLNRHEGETIYALDPWTGTEINLDVYGGAARAIIQFHAYDKQILPEVATIDPDKIKIDLKEPWGVMEVQAIRSTLNDQLKKLTDAQEKGKQLDGFVSKWMQEWMLQHDDTKSDQLVLEEEMGTHLKTVQRRDDFRESIEGCVGEFPSDDALIEGHKAVRKQIQILSDENTKLTNKLNEAKTPKDYKFSKSWKLFGEKYLVKMYIKEVKS